MMLAGRIRSTKTFFCSTISSPPGERIAWKILRAVSGHSCQVTGRTIASMYATPVTRSG